MQSLGRGALERMRAERVNAVDLLAEGLPWGVFHLLAGQPIPARQSLKGFLQEHGGTPAAYIAAGDACSQQGRSADALGAYREGLGLDPEARTWQPESTRVAELREQYRADPLFPGSWWVVGAYLDGVLPRYVRASPQAVTRRWERFQTVEQAPPPVRFFAGLFLSEHGQVLTARQLAAVRRTLRDLHPEGFASHLEQVSAEPLREPAAREAVWVW
jgi:hypothetical protein